jgi:MOSC domain-containing protein YiiM
VARLNVEGDEQADPTVHGGVKKAVYLYPSEHYEYWKERFPDMPMPWGSFGENFTTEGVLEDAVRPGDQLRVGSALLEVTKPRLPCFKLGIRFGTQRIVKWFLESERTGFYLQVLKEGEVRSGDPIDLVGADNGADTIAAIVRGVKKGEQTSGS